jgi:hypothetical protein
VNVVTIARFSNIVGAIVWIIGLPLVALSTVPFSSDATYFAFGAVSVLVGFATTPLVLAYPALSPAPEPLVGLVRVMGVAVCVVLVVTGALLMAGSTGLLGDRAPNWVPDAPVIGLVAFFVWVLLASYSTRRSTILGRWVFWLGILAGGSLLVASFISALVSFLDLGFIATDATIPFDLALDLLAWLCLPAWLMALTVRMRAAGRSGRNPDTTHEVEVASAR